MSSEVNLTPTSAIVLGFLELVGEATPYDLKHYAARSVGHFWTFQHAQLYTETERLAKAGLLREEREEGGRRRKHYSLTAAGKQALVDWRKQPTTELAELRDLGVLQLFFGADPRALGCGAGRGTRSASWPNTSRSASRPATTCRAALDRHSSAGSRSNAR
ncbi:MAG: PadR family transcriptional regulator [Thermoleophilaceae bacterium]